MPPRHRLRTLALASLLTLPTLARAGPCPDGTLSGLRCSLAQLQENRPAVQARIATLQDELGPLLALERRATEVTASTQALIAQGERRCRKELQGERTCR